MAYYLKEDVQNILSLEKKTLETFLESSYGEKIDLDTMSNTQLDEYSEFISQKDKVASVLVVKYGVLRHHIGDLKKYEKFEVFDGYRKS